MIRAVIVDVLGDGHCIAGHAITGYSDTIVYVGRPGSRFCRACHDAARTSRDVTRIISAQLHDARERDERIIDTVAIERRLKGEPQPLTATELRLAYQQAVARGWGMGRTLETLRICNAQRRRIEAAIAAQETAEREMVDA